MNKYKRALASYLIISSLMAFSNVNAQSSSSYEAELQLIKKEQTDYSNKVSTGKKEILSKYSTSATLEAAKKSKDELNLKYAVLLQSTEYKNQVLAARSYSNFDAIMKDSYVLFSQGADQSLKDIAKKDFLAVVDSKLVEYFDELIDVDDKIRFETYKLASLKEVELNKAYGSNVTQPIFDDYTQKIIDLGVQYGLEDCDTAYFSVVKEKEEITDKLEEEKKSGQPSLEYTKAQQDLLNAKLKHVVDYMDYARKFGEFYGSNISKADTTKFLDTLPTELATAISQMYLKKAESDKFKNSLQEKYKQNVATTDQKLTTLKAEQMACYKRNAEKKTNIGNKVVPPKENKTVVSSVAEEETTNQVTNTIQSNTVVTSEEPVALDEENDRIVPLPDNAPMPIEEKETTLWSKIVNFFKSIF